MSEKLQSVDIQRLPEQAEVLVVVEDKDFLGFPHHVSENSLVPSSANWRIVDVVILISITSTRLSENQLMIPDPMVLQPFNSLLSMILRPSSEKANVMALLKPLVDLGDRVRIGSGMSHAFRILVVYVLTDTAINVDDEDLAQTQILSR